MLDSPKTRAWWSRSIVSQWSGASKGWTLTFRSSETSCYVPTLKLWFLPYLRRRRRNRVLGSWLRDNSTISASSTQCCALRCLRQASSWLPSYQRQIKSSSIWSYLRLRKKLVRETSTSSTLSQARSRLRDAASRQNSVTRWALSPSSITRLANTYLRDARIYRLGHTSWLTTISQSEQKSITSLNSWS